MNEPSRSLNAKKSALRDAVRRKRVAFSKGITVTTATAAIHQHLLAAPLPWQGALVASYRAMGSEAGLEPVHDALIQYGAQLVWPRVNGPAGTPLDFGLGENKPDIVLLPLIAFDRNGGRLGQGGGYYDATLATWAAGEQSPLKIGIGFACQEVAAVPQDSHDQLLDWIVTEHGAYRVEYQDRNTV
jgi:5-formyltetrahydrofolate cyclo-ligase